MPLISDEYKINRTMIKNRVVMPPMVTFDYKAEDSEMPGKARIKEYYASRAKGGTGLIIIEALAIDEKGKLHKNQMGIWDDSQIAFLAEMTDAIHGNGAKVITQINFAGARSSDSNAMKCSPSGFDIREVESVALTVEEIREIQIKFVQAAARVKKAGCDGVEIHGAHGYLLSVFFDERTNKRQDEFGGSLEGRLKFAADLAPMIRNACGEDFIIAIRMGGNMPSVESAQRAAGIFEEAGYDLLDVSTGIDSPKNKEDLPEHFPCNLIVYNGTRIKQIANLPIIVVNEIKEATQAKYLIENNLADFVAVGRGIAKDPEWANKALHS